MEHFSDRLRYARKMRKLSQAQLGRASGLSQGAISSYETRTRKATTELVPLAQALQVNPIWLLTGVGPMDPPSDLPPLAQQPELRDFERKPVSVTWPFKTIPASEYWALSESKRRIVEHTVAGLIAALHDEQSNPDN